MTVRVSLFLDLLENVGCVSSLLKNAPSLVLELGSPLLYHVFLPLAEGFDPSECSMGSDCMIVMELLGI